MSFGALPDDYAGPTLRLGLWFDDHPGGTVSFAAGKVSDFDASIPESWGGGMEAIGCTLTAPNGESWTGWKEVPATIQTRQGQRPQPKNPEEFVGFQTKALGRALKRAGYPDGTGDLAELLRWRLVKHEIARGNGQNAVAALTAQAPPIADARLHTPVAAGRIAPQGAPTPRAALNGGPPSAPKPSSSPAAHIEASTETDSTTLGELLAAFSSVDDNGMEAIREKCTEWDLTADDVLTPGQARKVMAFAQSILTRQTRAAKD